MIPVLNPGTPVASDICAGGSANSAFSYAAIPAESEHALRASADHIRQIQQRMGGDIIALGLELVRAKALIGHGAFGRWLVVEFGWTDRTARRYMAVAQFARDKSDIVSEIEPTTLYLLSAASTPAPLAEAIVERFAGGEKVSAAAVRSTIRAARGHVSKGKREKSAEVVLGAPAAQRAGAGNGRDEQCVDGLDRVTELFNEIVAIIAKADRDDAVVMGELARDSFEILADLYGRRTIGQYQDESLARDSEAAHGGS